jgi:hypothetical protein
LQQQKIAEATIVGGIARKAMITESSRRVFLLMVLFDVPMLIPLVTLSEVFNFDVANLSTLCFVRCAFGVMSKKPLSQRLAYFLLTHL